jgi:hypothetical protein
MLGPERAKYLTSGGGSLGGEHGRALSQWVGRGADSIWDWVTDERGYMTDYRERRESNREEVVADYEQMLEEVEETKSLSERAKSHLQNIRALEKDDYLAAKHRKSQIIDRKLRIQAARNKRLGL